MGVSHGRTRVSELVFQVFSRSVHPDWYTVKAHGRVVRENWEADLRVIDGGHAVSFRSGKVRLSEILIGPDHPLPDLGLLFHSTIRHERSVTLRPGPAIEYQSCFEVERIDPEVFAHLSDELTLDATPGRLFHRYAPQNRLAPAPLSLLRFDAHARGLTVHAFHTFPEERAIVRTQSLFEPK